MRRSRRLALTACGLLLVMVAFLVWFVPQQIDWSRYRSQLEVLATSALGQDVRITGPIRVELLPYPVLTAGSVRVENTGENVSINARELRLRVGLGALLTGRLDPRELTLRRPDIRITGILPPLRPHVWQSTMTTHIVNGTLQLGPTRITGIDASLDTTDGLHVRGEASVNNAIFTYTARLSSPDGHGTSVLEIQAGSGSLDNVRATYSGTLTAAGEMNGQLAASGGNLARLVGAAVQPFQIQAVVHGTDGSISAEPLSIQIDQERLQGRATLTSAPQLTVALSAAQLDLTPWVALLTRNGDCGVPVDIDLTVEGATLHNRLLRRATLGVSANGDHAHLRHASATLPGDAQIELHDVTGQSGEQPVFTGTASIDAPTLRTTLDWLGLAQDSIPPEVLRQAKLQGGFSVSPNTFTASSITGTVDNVPLSGSIALRFAEQLTASANLTLERLSVDSWLDAVSMPVKPLADMNLSLHLNIPHATLRGQNFTATELEFSSDAAAMRIGKLVTHLADGTINLSGAYTSDGQISDLNIGMDFPDASALAAMLPAAWTGPAAVWNSPLHVQAQANGTADALAVQARGELSDIRIDTRITADLKTRQASGMLAVRHPNAPRLITLLTGLNPRENCNVRHDCDINKAGSAAWTWLGGGSLSLVTQFAATPTKITVPYFTLSAGTLQTRGDVVLSLEGHPTLTGTLTADTLPLPLQSDSAPLPIGYLRMLNADLTLHANTVLAYARPVLADLDGVLKLQDGGLSLTVQNAAMDGGTLAGTAVLSTATDAPALTADVTLRSINLASGMLPGLTGFADVTTQLTASGHSARAMLASLSGTIDIGVHDGIVNGISLTDALNATVLRPHAAAETALRIALESGATDFSLASGKATISNGMATLQGASIATDHGSIGIVGMVDLPRGTLNTRLTIRPNLPDFPDIGLVLTGPQSAPQRRVDLTGFGRWFSQQ